MLRVGWVFFGLVAYGSADAAPAGDGVVDGGVSVAALAVVVVVFVVFVGMVVEALVLGSKQGRLQGKPLAVVFIIGPCDQGLRRRVERVEDIVSVRAREGIFVARWLVVVEAAVVG